MRNFFENVFSGVGITDVIDIIIVAFVIYKLLGLIKQTKSGAADERRAPSCGCDFFVGILQPPYHKLAAQRRRDAGGGSHIGGFPAGAEACP